MKQELKENQGLPASLLWTLAIIAGISVANLYYNQPLLNRISRDLQTSEFTANLIAMITQIGYAIGLLFIIPLGDLFKRKTIILINFTVLVVSLLTIALTPYIHLILFASLLTGICSVMPQIFIPIVAQFSTPETKGKNVGMIVSGLLTGILASRVVSGIIGEYLGWRFIFFVATGMMVICVIIIMRVLPDMPCNFKGRYSDLMKSLFSLVMEYPQLRISSLRAGIAFGSFLALWTSLAFKMEQAPFFAGNNIVGLLGLCGIAGALTASYIGNYVQVLGVKRLNYIGCGLIFSAWFSLYSGQNSYVGIIIGIFIIDIGMQCIQLSNQTTIFSLSPKAANRINTIFMTTYFIGGSIGTLLAGIFWHWFGWQGVVGTGITLATCSFMINIFSKK
ncbi:MFS transporter [Phocaeicola vulgatus]|nr:MFS transporter [Phocaeicola vulgatus]